MNFDDQDWEQLGHPAQGEYRDHTTPWKVAAGVAVGMAVGALLVLLLDRAPTSGLPPAVGGNAPALVLDSPRAGVPSGAPPAASAVAPSPPGRVEAPAAGLPPGPKLSPPLTDPAAEAARRVAQQAAERRERAWAAFYRKPADCDENPTKATMVECANHYIRARREFEALFGPADKR